MFSIPICRSEFSGLLCSGCSSSSFCALVSAAPRSGAALLWEGRCSGEEEADWLFFFPAFFLCQAPSPPVSSSPPFSLPLFPPRRGGCLPHRSICGSRYYCDPHNRPPMQSHREPLPAHIKHQRSVQMPLNRCFYLQLCLYDAITFGLGNYSTCQRRIFLLVETLSLYRRLNTFDSVHLLLSKKR